MGHLRPDTSKRHVHSTLPISSTKSTTFQALRRYEDAPAPYIPSATTFTTHSMTNTALNAMSETQNNCAMAGVGAVVLDCSASDT